MKKKSILLAAFFLLLIGCKSIETSKDKGPDIIFTEENIDEYLGGDIYCSLESIKNFNEIMREKYETMNICGTVSNVGFEDLSGDRHRKYIEVFDDNNPTRYIKIYNDEEVQIGDTIYASGFFEKDSCHLSDSEIYRAEYKSENAEVTMTIDNNEKYLSVSDALTELDLCYETQIKVSCIIDAQEEFYCELESENQDDEKGIMCYTSEDLTDYDGEWVTIKGKFFIDGYGNYGLMDACLD